MKEIILLFVLMWILLNNDSFYESIWIVILYNWWINESFMMCIWWSLIILVSKILSSFDNLEFSHFTLMIMLSQYVNF